MDYRSPIMADDLQMPTAPRLQHWQRAPEGRFTRPAALPGDRVLYSLPPQWTCRLLPNVLHEPESRQAGQVQLAEVGRSRGLTNAHIPAYTCSMRRKAGVLIPIERSILEAAMHLRRLRVDEFHGFQMAKEIKEQREARLLIGHGTLYRALGRLEQQGFLRSRWEDPMVAAEHNRPRRKLYELTAQGGAVGTELLTMAAEPMPPAWRAWMPST